MPKRGGKVHVATTRRHYKETEYKTTLLRRSYREGGKVKNETLGNLSHLPDHVIDGLRAMLAGRRLVDLDSDFEIVRSLPHGHVAAVLGVLRELGLHMEVGLSRRRGDRPSRGGKVAGGVMWFSAAGATRQRPCSRRWSASYAGTCPRPLFVARSAV